MAKNGAIVGGMALGGVASAWGSLGGEATRNIAGMTTEKGFRPSYDPMDTVIAFALGGATAGIPAGDYAGGLVASGGKTNLYRQITQGGLFNAGGDLKAVYNPLRQTGRYFYSSIGADEATYETLEWIVRSIPKFG